MPVAPLINLDALTEPLPGDTPAGEKLPFTVKEKLDDLRRDYDPDETETVVIEGKSYTQPKPRDPNWRGIISLASDTLTKTSRDLLVAVRLVEALTKQHGFAGVRDGLALLRKMTADCWDGMWPKVEEPDDLPYRALPYQWLADTTGAALFPNTLRAAPIVSGNGVVLSWQTDADSRDPKKDASLKDSLDKLTSAVSVEAFQETDATIGQALDEYAGLEQVLSEKFGSEAPGLRELKGALEESRRLAQRYIQQRGGGAAESAEDSAGAPGGTSPAAATGGGEPLRNRDDCYRQLGKIADMLKVLDPHSPVPSLLQQVVALKGKDFSQIVETLTKQQNVLEFMKQQPDSSE